MSDDPTMMPSTSLTPQRVMSRTALKLCCPAACPIFIDILAAKL